MATEHDEHAEALIQQQELLTTHRRTLAHLLRQAAIFGPLTPPHIAHGITEARTAIAQIKDAQRAARIIIDDMPGDLPGTAPIERRAHWLRLLGVLIIVVVLAVTVLGVSGGVAGMRTRLDVWGVLPLIPPEQPGETLLVIAPFYYTEGNRNTEAHREIARAVQRAAQDSGLTNFRIAVATISLRADDRKGAEQLGARYNASLVVWGDDTGVRVTVNFLNRRGTPEIIARDVTISETKRSQIADPPAYARFVTDDLPRQLSFLALFAVGQSYKISGDYRIATRILEQAVMVVTQTTELEGLDAAYFYLGWLYQVQIHDLAHAITNYDQVIRLNPQHATAYYNRGIVRADQGDLAGAIKDYDQAITLNPQDADAYYNRGVARADQGDLAGAIKDYDQAITLNPQQAATYNNRGAARSDLGDLAGAIKDYDQAITLNPQYAAAYYNRGAARSDLGNLAGAIKDYDQAITLNPQEAAAYFNRGNAHAAQGDLAGAIKDYDQAITLNPQYAAAYNNRGVARKAQGDLAGAIKDYDQAITLNPQDADAYFNRGNAHAAQGELAGAIEDYDQAIKLNPQDALFYANRGHARKAEGELVGAIADFEQVLRLTDNPELRREAEEQLRELRKQ